MKRRMLSIILTLAMVLSLLPSVTLTASAAFDGGDGTSGNPYMISTAEQLQEFAGLVNDGETTLCATLTR